MISVEKQRVFQKISVKWGEGTENPMNLAAKSLIGTGDEAACFLALRRTLPVKEKNPQQAKTAFPQGRLEEAVRSTRFFSALLWRDWQDLRTWRR